jgi:sterol desaturase/sphingolipid hydroxylase (fatty acid hydroxylase superfamily)
VHPLSPWVSGALVVPTFLILTWLERRRPLRREVEPKSRRLPRNLAVATLSEAIVRWLELPLLLPLATRIEGRSWGVLGLVHLPAVAELVVALLLFDYTLYVWHVLTHRVPLLWRLHVVHHIDLDLDASTALRFHFAEIAVSIGWRAAQVVAIGASPLALTVWQTALLLSTMFHHANVALPLAVERRLVRWVVTPRMHGIHHSTVREETDSNWSSGLTLWDRLHGTLRLDVRQDEITIGVPAYQAPSEVTLPRVLALPFQRQRPTWRDAAGSEPRRPPRTPSLGDLPA